MSQQTVLTHYIWCPDAKRLLVAHELQFPHPRFVICPVPPASTLVYDLDILCTLVRLQTLLQLPAADTEHEERRKRLLGTLRSAHAQMTCHCVVIAP